MRKMKKVMNLLQVNWRTMAEFEILYKVLSPTIFTPLFLRIFNGIMKVTGYQYLTIENVFSFFLNPLTLLALLLLIEEFLVVKYFADRRLGVRRDFHEVEFQLFGNAACFVNGVDAGGNVVADETHFTGSYMLVDVVWRLLLLAWVGATLLRAWSGGCGAWCSGIVRRFFIHSGCFAAV